MAKFDLSFFYNKRNLYILGFLLAFVVTFMEVSRGRHLNFLAFADSTIDFWRGVSPYTPEFVSSHMRFFLYTPVFSVLFTPFAVLPAWLGPFVWNLLNYTMFFAAVIHSAPHGLPTIKSAVFFSIRCRFLPRACCRSSITFR